MPINLGELLDSFSGAKVDETYREKMMHPIPQNIPIVHRVEYILEKCKGKVVADLGCASGKLHGLIQSVAKDIIGFDKNQPTDFTVDFDDPNNCNLFIDKQIEIYVIAELIEHLRNPGFFLDNLRKAMHSNPKSVALFTAPNAFSMSGFRSMMNGIECVNKDHKWFPSFFTMKTLLEGSGFIINDFKWYGVKGDKPGFTEGLIFMVD